MYKVLKNMKIVLFFLAILIISASSSSQGNTEPSKNVNVELETSVLFEPQKLEENIKLVKNVKIFLDNLYEILTAPELRNSPKLRGERRELPVHGRELPVQHHHTFAEFLDDASKSIFNFTSNKIHESVDGISDKIVKLTESSKSALFNVVANNVLQSSLRSIAKAKEDTVNFGVDQAVKAEKSLLRTIGQKMNNYYSDKEVKKLRRLVKKLNKHMEEKKDPTHIVYDIVNIGFIDKYRSMNNSLRMNLVKDVFSIFTGASEPTTTTTTTTTTTVKPETKAKSKKKKSKHKKKKRHSKKRHHHHHTRKNKDSDSISSKETDEVTREDTAEEEKEDRKENRKSLDEDDENSYKKDKLTIKDKNGNELVVDNIELFVKALTNA